MLLDSLGSTQEADNGVLALGTPVRRALGCLAPCVHPQR